jgi:hypothetical protein
LKPLTLSSVPAVHPQIQIVSSFQELISTPFAGDVNALCWPRKLAGDFGEVVAQFGAGEGITILDEDCLKRLSLSPAGQQAVAILLEDQRLLREHDLDPVLNCIHGYPRDEEPGAVRTDVFSFHVDSAPVQADTWLCTYHGPASDGLPNEQAVRRVDVAETRAALLQEYGGADDADFLDYLSDHCYDLGSGISCSCSPFFALKVNGDVSSFSEDRPKEVGQK